MRRFASFLKFKAPPNSRWVTGTFTTMHTLFEQGGLADKKFASAVLFNMISSDHVCLPGLFRVAFQPKCPKTIVSQRKDWWFLWALLLLCVYVKQIPIVVMLVQGAKVKQLTNLDLVFQVIYCLPNTIVLIRFKSFLSRNAVSPVSPSAFFKRLVCEFHLFFFA